VDQSIRFKRLLSLPSLRSRTTVDVACYIAVLLPNLQKNPKISPKIVLRCAVSLSYDIDLRSAKSVYESDLRNF